MCCRAVQKPSVNKLVVVPDVVVTLFQLTHALSIADFDQSKSPKND